MVAKAKFAPLQTGDELSLEVALSQSSSIIDVATEIAIGRGDVESLISLAALYLELGSRMVFEETEQYEPVDEECKPFGFMGNQPEIIGVTEEDE